MIETHAEIGYELLRNSTLDGLNDRVYRSAFSSERAVEIMREDDGHFDPDLLDLFVEHVAPDARHAVRT